jgi:hypothetical protein
MANNKKSGRQQTTEGSHLTKNDFWSGDWGQKLADNLNRNVLKSKAPYLDSVEKEMLQNLEEARLRQNDPTYKAPL